MRRGPPRQFFFWLIHRVTIHPWCHIWPVGVHPCAPFCRSLSLPISWKRRFLHKRCRHILGIKIKIKQESVQKCLPTRSQDIGLSHNTFSKKGLQHGHYFIPPGTSTFQQVYPKQYSSYERRTSETCIRNTNWCYTKDRMVWKALNI